VVLEAVERGKLTFADRSVGVDDDALVVHCAADCLKYPGLVPVWRSEGITLQAIRAGFPCFGAAVTGYVEATRQDDADKNRLCPPTGFPNSMADCALMNLRGTQAVMSFMSEPDIKDWSSRVAINPARIRPEHPGSPSAHRQSWLGRS
jgi:hypothetical protein